MGRPKMTTEQWVEQAKTTHGDTFDYSKSVFVGYGKPLEVICKEHGSFFQRENNHRNGAGCPTCGVDSRRTARSMTYEGFVSAANKVHEYGYIYPDEQPFTNSRTKVRIICPTHGEFVQMATTHLLGQGCRACGYERNGRRSQLGLSEFLSRAREVHGDVYTYVSGLSGMNKKIRIVCERHGEFSQTPANHLNGAGCPRCVNGVSKGEEELAEFVSSLGVVVVTSDRTTIKPFELDVYVPSKKVAIEYNGLWFHREELVGSKTRDKWERCAAIGVTLIQVFEDEWRDNQEQVKSRLRAILGISNKLPARKCVVRSVAPAEARDFLTTHHTQGPSTALNIAYGLYHEDVIVALATFGRGRFNNTGWELLRYCSEGRVVGGISKLVAAFRKEHPEGDLVSYADLRWGNGEGYAAAGFSFVHITEPDYWWADCKQVKRIPRYRMQKHRTGMPEKEYAKAQGYHKILGVGHKKWVLPEVAA